MAALAYLFGLSGKFKALHVYYSNKILHGADEAAWEIIQAQTGLKIIRHWDKAGAKFPKQGVMLLDEADYFILDQQAKFPVNLNVIGFTGTPATQ